MGGFKAETWFPESMDYLKKYGRPVVHRDFSGNNPRPVMSNTKDGLEILLKDFYGHLHSGFRVGRKGSTDWLLLSDSYRPDELYELCDCSCFALAWSGKNGKPVESKKLYVLYDSKNKNYTLREKTDYVRDRLAKLKRYQVIGGQYEQFWYGQSDTFRGAKMIAGRNNELWDNWQGWHTPVIYRAEDCMLRECEGMITKRDGVKMVMHNPEAYPVVKELNDEYEVAFMRDKQRQREERCRMEERGLAPDYDHLTEKEEEYLDSWGY